MGNICFTPVLTDGQLSFLSHLADGIWRECYARILSAGQIEYMLDRFLSVEVLRRQIYSEGYEYYLMEKDDEVKGLVGIKYEKDRLFLSKLYIKSSCRGEGAASRTMCFLEEKCRTKHLSSIYLTVNKYNDHARRVYEKKGFVITDSVVSDIGQGYVMDDYIMEKRLTHE